MKRLDWILLIATAILILTAFASLAAASEWDRPSVTLKPSEYQVVSFTNTENKLEDLVIVNISCPDQLLPFVLVLPSSVPAYSTENITIQFVAVPISVRQALPQDVFAVKLIGGNSSLVVYLDLSVPIPENVLADVYARIDNLLARIRLLENKPDLQGLVDNLSSEIDDLRATIPENTEWQAKLDNLEARLSNLITQLRQDFVETGGQQTAETGIPTGAVVAGVGIVIVGVIGYKMGWFRRALPKPSGPPTKIPEEDQVARAKNILKARGIEIKEKGDQNG